LTHSGHELSQRSPPFQPARLTQYDALSRASGAAMRRREFVSLLSSAAVTWPVVGHAQQRVMPVVGVLCAGTAEALERSLASFREGMRQLGYVEGSNVHFEFRFADGY